MENINTELIFKETMKNGGYTLERKGVTGRYSVGLKVLGYQLPLRYFYISDIENYLNEGLLHLDNSTVGTWIDTDTDIVYIDTVVLVDELDEAIQIARKNSQIAIYDLVENKEIRL